MTIALPQQQGLRPQLPQLDPPQRQGFIPQVEQQLPTVCGTTIVDPQQEVVTVSEHGSHPVELASIEPQSFLLINQ